LHIPGYGGDIRESRKAMTRAVRSFDRDNQGLRVYFAGLLDGWDRPGDDAAYDVKGPYRMGLADGSAAAMEIGAAMVEPGKGGTV